MTTTHTGHPFPVAPTIRSIALVVVRKTIMDGPVPASEAIIPTIPDHRPPQWSIGPGVFGTARWNPVSHRYWCVPIRTHEVSDGDDHHRIGVQLGVSVRLGMRALGCMVSSCLSAPLQQAMGHERSPARTLEDGDCWKISVDSRVRTIPDIAVPHRGVGPGNARP